MVRRILLLLASCLALTVQAQRAYMVADATTGYILDSSNAREKLQVGSLTKIATAMVVIDWALLNKEDLNQTARIPASAASLGGANPVGFQPGDQASLRDLMYAALLQSDNVAATALAVHIGQSLPGQGTPYQRFVAQMNALARKLGMSRTRFLNPHGLDNEEQPYSTAADMARLSKYAMANAAFRFYVHQRERRINVTSASGTQASYVLRNTNELLNVNAIDGVKTGRTALAGDCVIISAARPPETSKQGDLHIITPRRLIVVVLSAENRFEAASRLLQNGWRLYDTWASAGRPSPKRKLL